MVEPTEVDDTDPDVIPNQYGRCLKAHRIPSDQRLIVLYAFVCVCARVCFAERRPLKSQHMPPLFRSPSARLIQRDDRTTDDDSGVDRRPDMHHLGSATLGGSNKEVHHYTFQPSKQIVSIVLLCVCVCWSVGR